MKVNKTFSLQFEFSFAAFFCTLLFLGWVAILIAMVTAVSCWLFKDDVFTEIYPRIFFIFLLIEWLRVHYRAFKKDWDITRALKEGSI